MNKKIILIASDPKSINSEIIFKSLRKIKKSLRKKIFLIANYDLIEKQFKKLKYRFKFEKVKNINSKNQTSNLKVINIKANFTNPFNLKKKDASKYIISSLNFAHKAAFNKDIKGIINCPLDKKLLPKKTLGVTEYLAQKCKIKDNSQVMLIWNERIAVCPITTHINIKDIPKKIDKSIIIKKVKTINSWYKNTLKRKPKIAILGLNPHNSEYKKKSEEVKIIIPAIKKLKKMKISVKGPYAADTIFINDYKKFDLIVGMYHDQVLTPFKTIHKFNAINITLGLKYLRVSPDHGTSMNLLYKNKANPYSLIKCINFVDKF